MRAPKRYTEEEAYAMLQRISAEAQADTMPMIHRFSDLEQEFDEVFEAVLADGTLAKYAAAINAFFIATELQRSLKPEDPDTARTALMLKLATWFYMFKQDILTRLGAEE